MNLSKPIQWTNPGLDPKPEPGPIDHACHDVLALEANIREHLAQVMTVTRELTALRQSFIDGDRYADSKSFSIGIPLTPEELMFAKRRQLNESLKDLEALLDDFRDRLRVLVNETLLPAEATRLQLTSALQEPPAEPDEPSVVLHDDFDPETLRREMQEVIEGAHQHGMPSPPEPKGFLARLRMRD